MTAAALSVRVPAELKARMANHPERNWSAFIREAVDDELERIERLEAARAIDALRARVPPGGASSEEIVRRMRDGRYGPET